MFQPEMIKTVDNLVTLEMGLAQRKHGYIMSGHESYGVLKEEIEEAEVELEEIATTLELLWMDVKRDDNAGLIASAMNISKRAKYLALEAIQVASVANRAARYAEMAERSKNVGENC